MPKALLVSDIEGMRLTGLGGNRGQVCVKFKKVRGKLRCEKLAAPSRFKKKKVCHKVGGRKICFATTGTISARSKLGKRVIGAHLIAGTRRRKSKRSKRR
jgi:hypothetical protein